MNTHEIEAEGAVGVPPRDAPIDEKIAWLDACRTGLLLGFTLGWGAVGLWWGLSAGLCVVAVVLTWRFLRISSRRIEAV